MSGPVVRLMKGGSKMENQMDMEQWSTRYYLKFSSSGLLLNSKIKDWKYIGEFKGGKFHGTGAFYWSKLNYYEGEMKALKNNPISKFTSLCSTNNQAWCKWCMVYWYINII